MSDAGPSAVRNLSLSSGGSSASLRAAWAHGHGRRDGYRLALWHSDSQTLVRNVSLLPGTSTFLFNGLLAGSEYALKVSTLAGTSQASTSIHQWTGREGWLCLPREEGVVEGVWQEGCSTCAGLMRGGGLQAWDGEPVYGGEQLECFTSPLGAECLGRGENLGLHCSTHGLGLCVPKGGGQSGDPGSLGS